MPDTFRASNKVPWSSRKGVERGYDVLSSQKIGLSGNTGNAGHGLKMVRNTEEEEDMMMMMMMVKNKTLFQCWKQMIIARRQIPLTKSQEVLGSLVIKLYGM